MTPLFQANPTRDETGGGAKSQSDTALVMRNVCEGGQEITIEGTPFTRPKALYVSHGAREDRQARQQMVIELYSARLLGRDTFVRNRVSDFSINV